MDEIISVNYMIILEFKIKFIIFLTQQYKYISFITQLIYTPFHSNASVFGPFGQSFYATKMDKRTESAKKNTMLRLIAGTSPLPNSPTNTVC